MDIKKLYLEDPDDVPLKYKQMIKHQCETSFLFFCRFFFKATNQSTLLLNKHHWLLAETLQRVYDGEIARLIINMPPRYTKTIIITQMFTAYGLMMNPKSNWFNVSYDLTLALDNSRIIREIIKCEWFQALWKLDLKKDTDAKGLWRTEENGGVKSDSSGGGLTGFGAGSMESLTHTDLFWGAFILDDPNKPDDAFSDVKREKINRRFTNTFKSRLAVPTTPIILIQQRLHEDDASGFLLRGGDGEMWHHLLIPVEIEKGYEDEYNPDYTHGTPIKTNFKVGVLWEEKHNQEQVDILKKDVYTFDSQYMQRPSPLSGDLFKPEYWRYYKDYNFDKNIITKLDGEQLSCIYRCIYADTAQKKGQANDYTVFILVGKGQDGNVYILDVFRDKLDDPELKKEFIDFCEKYEYKSGQISVGLRSIKVEDKSSGIGLIQYVNKEKGFDWVEGIPRNTDKLSRARGGVLPIAEGKILLPASSIWLTDYVTEFKRFTVTDTHQHDDQIDATLDAIQDLIIDDTSIQY